MAQFTVLHKLGDEIKNRVYCESLKDAHDTYRTLTTELTERGFFDMTKDNVRIWDLLRNIPNAPTPIALTKIMAKWEGVALTIHVIRLYKGWDD